VLCVDERSQIQAFDRSQPLLPVRPGQVERRTHYGRHARRPHLGSIRSSASSRSKVRRPSSRYSVTTLTVTMIPRMILIYSTRVLAFLSDCESSDYLHNLDTFTTDRAARGLHVPTATRGAIAGSPLRKFNLSRCLILKGARHPTSQSAHSGRKIKN